MKEENKKYKYKAAIDGKSIKKMYKKIGECPNVELPTLGGKTFWDTVAEVDEWKLQVNRLTGWARILNPKNIRKAWGEKAAMEEKFDRITRPHYAERGDIICIIRKGIYKHYAVYIGDDEVIHYSAEGNDFGKEVTIHRAPMSEFLKDDKEFLVLQFPEEEYLGLNRETSLLSLSDFGLSQSETKELSTMGYHLYTREETVERAMSKLGESNYDLVTNNCEHFAIWCKTGIAESRQVDKIVNKVAGFDPIAPVLDFISKV